jgi:hypothetical protein
MRTVAAAALAAFLVVSSIAPISASDGEPPAQTTDQATESSSDAATSNAEDGTMVEPDTSASPEPDAAATKAPINVHRHRPGACPEGPPCKVGD